MAAVQEVVEDLESRHFEEIILLEIRILKRLTEDELEV